MTAPRQNDATMCAIVLQIIIDAGEEGVTYEQIAHRAGRSEKHVRKIAQSLDVSGSVLKGHGTVTGAYRPLTVLRASPLALQELRECLEAPAEPTPEVSAPPSRLSPHAQAALKILAGLSTRNAHALAAAAGYSYRHALQLWQELEQAGVA